jgi:hypothetical protein
MSHCFQYLFFRFSNCFNAGFELTGPRASFSFCVLFFASFLVSFHVLVSNDKRSALGPAATDSANYSLRTIPVLSASLGRKVVALSFICSRRNSGKTLAARKKKTIIAVIRLSLGVSTFGQNCSPYAHTTLQLQLSSNGSVCIRQVSLKFIVSPYHHLFTFHHFTHHLPHLHLVFVFILFAKAVVFAICSIADIITTGDLNIR